MRIAITCRLDEIKSYGETRMSLDIAWFDLLNSISKQLYILPINNTIDYEVLGKSDMIIFTGGNDLSLYCPSWLSTLRDHYEQKILDYAIKRSIPVVGVCRGMQFINQYFGGSIEPIQSHVNQSHPLDIEALWIPRLSLFNSFHAWGITQDSLAKELIPSAFSDNKKYVEAFSHSSLPIRAVMWHPERFIPATGDIYSYYKLQASIFKFS